MEHFLISCLEDKALAKFEVHRANGEWDFASR